jgi:hypothetical protein
MPPLKNHLEILKLLPKTNCKECHLPTCLTFAVAVINGQKGLADCPYLDEETVSRFGEEPERPDHVGEEQSRRLAELRAQVAGLDFASAARRLEVPLSQGNLVIKCLGKDFQVDPQGRITSQCHTNPWLTIPLLNYIVRCQGGDLSGDWVPFRELDHGVERNPLFEQRCERPLRRIADQQTDLFEDIIDIFNAHLAPDLFSADIAIILHPLPRFPVLICYWKPEDGLESSLNVFFDAAANKVLETGSIFNLVAGMTRMFEKITSSHGS